ncbi:hypothetical protein [Streptacidiphilus rugosus]|uniref:hypothetical protein n=1 Tax=Streptacidiphilus rugosus TaxID=405783 RepID=UPI000689BCB0|nr:hypothetical protein [Streptacidiphilus rugosus]
MAVPDSSRPLRDRVRLALPLLDRPRAVLSAGAGTAVLLVLALGTDTLWLRLTEVFGSALRPAALGVPLFLPGLRPNPRGETSWAFTCCEDFAALLLVGVVALVLRKHTRRHPYASVAHLFLTGWRAVVLGGAAAGVFRGLTEARMVAAGPLGWTGYPVLGALAGLGWGLLLGWTVGLVVALTGAVNVRHGENHEARWMARR